MSDNQNSSKYIIRKGRASSISGEVQVFDNLPAGVYLAVNKSNKDEVPNVVLEELKFTFTPPERILNGMGEYTKEVFDYWEKSGTPLGYNIAGAEGTGKTFSVQLAIHEAISRNIPVIVIKPSLLGIIKPLATLIKHYLGKTMFVIEEIDTDISESWKLKSWIIKPILDPSKGNYMLLSTCSEKKYVQSSTTDSKGKDIGPFCNDVETNFGDYHFRKQLGGLLVKDIEYLSKQYADTEEQEREYIDTLRNLRERNIARVLYLLKEAKRTGDTISDIAIRYNMSTVWYAEVDYLKLDFRLNRDKYVEIKLLSSDKRDDVSYLLSELSRYQNVEELINRASVSMNPVIMTNRPEFDGDEWESKLRIYWTDLNSRVTNDDYIDLPSSLQTVTDPTSDNLHPPAKVKKFYLRIMREGKF